MRRVILILVAFLSQSCLALKDSPLDTSNGGMAGALLTILLTPASGRFVAFTNSTTIYESTDGSSWTARTLSGASSIADAAVTGQTVFGLDSGTNNLRRSFDGGRTWTSVSTAAVTLGKIGACGSAVAASTSGGASYQSYYSSNTGTSFSVSTIDGSSAITPRNIVCSDSSHFLSASNTAPPVSYSASGASAWAAASGPLAGAYVVVRGGSVRAVAVYPATNPYVTLSTDYGVSFGAADSATLSTLTNGAIQGAMADDGTRFHLGFFTASTCYFFRSTTGANASWSQASAPCPATGSLVTLASGGGVLVSGGGAGSPLVVRSADSGATWSVVSMPSGSAITKIVYVP